MDAVVSLQPVLVLLPLMEDFYTSLVRNTPGREAMNAKYDQWEAIYGNLQTTECQVLRQSDVKDLKSDVLPSDKVVGAWSDRLRSAKDQALAQVICITFALSICLCLCLCICTAS